MRRPIKIAVAGSHSTGKTSFLEALEPAIQEMGLRVERVHDSAADAQALGFPILSGHTFESTAWLMARAIELETAASIVAEVVLIDRPLHDALGYFRAALCHSGRNVEQVRMRSLERICEAWADEYDLMFVTAIDPNIPVGRGRDADLRFRELAATKVREVIETYFPSRWRLLGSESHDDVLRTIRDRPVAA